MQLSDLFVMQQVRRVLKASSTNSTQWQNICHHAHISRAFAATNMNPTQMKRSPKLTPRDDCASCSTLEMSLPVLTSQSHCMLPCSSVLEEPAETFPGLSISFLSFPSNMHRQVTSKTIKCKCSAFASGASQVVQSIALQNARRPSCQICPHLHHESFAGVALHQSYRHHPY